MFSELDDLAAEDMLHTPEVVDATLQLDQLLSIGGTGAQAEQAMHKWMLAIENTDLARWKISTQKPNPTGTRLDLTIKMLA